MPTTLTFLHTSPAHVATFDRLLAAMDPVVPAAHVVDESLLHEARATGLTPALEQRITATIREAVAAGAATVVCTCSTIGGAAERAAHSSDPPVLRLDRAMAEQAVASGGRLVVVAALASTLAPTRQLLLDVAARMGTAVTLREVVCAGAWAHFERGDHPAYLAAVAMAVRESARAGDVVVLAQASMAGAAALCADLRLPILSSPRPGLAAALRAYRAHR